MTGRNRECVALEIRECGVCNKIVTCKAKDRFQTTDCRLKTFPSIEYTSVESIIKTIKNFLNNTAMFLQVGIEPNFTYLHRFSRQPNHFMGWPVKFVKILCNKTDSHASTGWNSVKFGTQLVFFWQPNHFIKNPVKFEEKPLFSYCTALGNFMIYWYPVIKVVHLPYKISIIISTRTTFVDFHGETSSQLPLATTLTNSDPN